MGFVRKYWGYLLLVVLALAIYNGSFSAVGLVAVSAAVALYAMFQAPTVCAVENSTGPSPYCRNNAHGLLMGCHIRQHKWQKFKLMFIPQYWHRVGKAFHADPVEALKTSAALIAALGAVLGATVGLINAMA